MKIKELAIYNLFIQDLNGKKWSRASGSNRDLSDLEADALPIKLARQVI